MEDNGAPPKIPRRSRAAHRFVVTTASLIGLALAATASAGTGVQRPAHRIDGMLGAQIGLAEYRSHFKLAVAYAYPVVAWLALDLSFAALAAEGTNLFWGIGVRWPFLETDYRLRAYLRGGLEVAHLLDGPNRVVPAGRGAVGVAYFHLTPRVGAIAEVGLALGPSLGGPDGTSAAAGLDILVGVDVPL